MRTQQGTIGGRPSHLKWITALYPHISTIATWNYILEEIHVRKENKRSIPKMLLLTLSSCWNEHTSVIGQCEELPCVRADILYLSFSSWRGQFCLGYSSSTFSQATPLFQHFNFLPCAKVPTSNLLQTLSQIRHRGRWERGSWSRNEELSGL